MAIKLPLKQKEHKMKKAVLNEKNNLALKKRLFKLIIKIVLFIAEFCSRDE